MRTDDVELADKDQRILDLRRSGGWSPRKIAEILTAEGCPTTMQTVNKRIKVYVDSVKEQQSDLIAKRLTEQDDFLDDLIGQCKRQLLKGFDAGVIRVAVLCCERQAKLLGLDNGTKVGDRKDWLDNASDTELIELATRYGLTPVEKFQLVA